VFAGHFVYYSHFQSQFTQANHFNITMVATSLYKRNMVIDAKDHAILSAPRDANEM